MESYNQKMRCVKFTAKYKEEFNYIEKEHQEEGLHIIDLTGDREHTLCGIAYVDEIHQGIAGKPTCMMCIKTLKEYGSLCRELTKQKKK